MFVTPRLIESSRVSSDGSLVAVRWSSATVTSEMPISRVIPASGTPAERGLLGDLGDFGALGGEPLDEWSMRPGKELSCF